MKCNYSLLFGVLICAGLSSSVQAESEVTVRSGWTLGVGIGLGEMSADCSEGCSGALASLSFDAHAGYIVAPQLAIVLDLWTLGHPAEIVTLWHSISTICVQYWTSPKLSLFDQFFPQLLNQLWKDLIKQ